MPDRKICVVTGSRADYGLLRGVMREIQADPALALQVVATGMHWVPEFGLTYRRIEEDGFSIDAKVESLLASDSAVGTAKSTGLGLIGLADALDRLRPDIVLLLGDRFEVFAAAQAALFARLPVAHIAGGDTTEGAFDEAIRHAITKMSHLHFVTHSAAAARVRQLGENPEHIFNVGSPGLDVLRELQLMSKGEIERELGFRFRSRNLLVTFHPATLERQPATEQLQELLVALGALGQDVGLLFTLPNADTGARALLPLIEAFVSANPNAKAFPSLGQLRYLSVMSHVDAVVGNSSSGLYEAPSLGTPTVNIGDRQNGRPLASSVVSCKPFARDIRSAIERAFELDVTGVVNPYGDGRSSARIRDHLKRVEDPARLLMKSFHDLPGGSHG